jgi:transposase
MVTGRMDNITYVGLDVHKATVCVALAESGRGGEVRQVGLFENRPEILCKLAARLGKGGRRLSFCYEAGPCGYGLHRLLTGCGRSCIVVAPSPIPMKSGDRVKTDRRDAMMLAKPHRAGEPTAIWIPDAAHEAMRDLVRARVTGGRVLSKARQHLQGFLLRHDRIYRGARAWTQAYRRWLTTVRFEHPAQQIVLQNYIMLLAICRICHQSDPLSAPRHSGRVGRLPRNHQIAACRPLAGAPLARTPRRR